MTREEVRWIIAGNIKTFKDPNYGNPTSSLFNCYNSISIRRSTPLENEYAYVTKIWFNDEGATSNCCDKRIAIKHKYEIGDVVCLSMGIYINTPDNKDGNYYFGIITDIRRSLFVVHPILFTKKPISNTVECLMHTTTCRVLSHEDISYAYMNYSYRNLKLSSAFKKDNKQEFVYIFPSILPMHSCLEIIFNEYIENNGYGKLYNTIDKFIKILDRQKAYEDKLKEDRHNHICEWNKILKECRIIEGVIDRYIEIYKALRDGDREINKIIFSIVRTDMPEERIYEECDRIVNGDISNIAFKPFNTCFKAAVLAYAYQNRGECVDYASKLPDKAEAAVKYIFSHNNWYVLDTLTEYWLKLVRIALIKVNKSANNIKDLSVVDFEYIYRNASNMDDIKSVYPHLDLSKVILRLKGYIDEIKYLIIWSSIGNGLHRGITNINPIVYDIIMDFSKDHNSDDEYNKTYWLFNIALSDTMLNHTAIKHFLDCMKNKVMPSFDVINIVNMMTIKEQNAFFRNPKKNRQVFDELCDTYGYDRSRLDHSEFKKLKYFFTGNH